MPPQSALKQGGGLEFQPVNWAMVNGFALFFYCCYYNI
jgi:hypothetical protein